VLFYYLYRLLYILHRQEFAYDFNQALVKLDSKAAFCIALSHNKFSLEVLFEAIKPRKV
jgi:lysophospholipid acyltransferase (LPLAT)-like uncharacterized protein